MSAPTDKEEGKRAHKPSRIRAGLYNYRGFNIRRCRTFWIMRNEDGGIFRSEPSIRTMCGFIDSNYKRLSKAS